MVFSAEGSRPSALFKRKRIKRMKNSKKALYKLLFALFMILFIGAAGFMAYEEYQIYKIQQQLGEFINTESESGVRLCDPHRIP